MLVLTHEGTVFAPRFTSNLTWDMVKISEVLQTKMKSIEYLVGDDKVYIKTEGQYKILKKHGTISLESNFSLINKARIIKYKNIKMYGRREGSAKFQFFILFFYFLFLYSNFNF